MLRKRLLVPATIVVAAMTAAACGSSSNKGSTNSTARTTVAPPPQSTAAQQGVTDDAIKIGVAMVDFKPIQSFIDFNHGDEQEVTKVFVDAINKAGGIGGRKLEAVYQKYTPIGSQGPTAVCTKFTEDDKVFAVLGNIVDPTGASQICVTKQHKTVMFGHDLSDVMTNAQPGLMLTPDITAERRLNVLLSVLKQRDTLKDKKVAVLAETSTKSRIKSTIDPALKAMNVDQGTPAVLDTGATTDTSAAQRQLDSFIERWKTEGVNAVIVSGQDVVAKQFVTKLAKGLPDALLMTDSHSSGVQAAQDLTHSGVTPNPYEGMLTVNGLTDEQSFDTETMQKCVQTYKDNGGTQPVTAPEDLKPNADGKRVQVWVAISDMCREFTLFQQVAEKAGKYLNNDNWIRAVATLGAVKDLPGSQYASLKNGKYDADDTFSLVEFNAKDNDFVPISPVVNAAEG